jgi:hypothetical protein
VFWVQCGEDFALGICVVEAAALQYIMNYSAQVNWISSEESRLFVDEVEPGSGMALSFSGL